ncbi:aldehyde dehydrogenase family protein, partial [Bacillus safensis]|nr:aldehyde dehydrogenase family protein [Bacillus safensis]
GALKELSIGRTDRLNVDIGPVITDEAKTIIEKHVQAMRDLGRKVEQLPLGAETEKGTFVGPTIIEINSLLDLKREV